MRAAHLIHRLPGAASGTVRRGGAAIPQWQVWRLGEPLRTYVVAFPVLAAAVIGLAVSAASWRPRDTAIFVGLIMCGMIAVEATRSVREVHGTVARDLQTVWYLAIAIAVPPVYALLAPIPLAAYKLLRVQRTYVYRRVFSNATIALAYGCASVAFRAIPANVAGAGPGTGVHALTWTLAVAVCGLLAWVANNVPLVTAVRLADPGARLRNLVASAETITSDLIELSLAISLALMVAINPVLMLLALPSTVLYRRYLLHAQLVSQARIDAKTGLLNAATWHSEATIELARAVRTRTPLAVAVADIDHFKNVNDTFGHLAGDHVLRELARALQSGLRDYDIVGRFGGEEFTLLLPQTDPCEAAQVAERVRDQVDQRVITIDDGSRTGFRLRVTISVGVATLNGSHRDLNDLIAAADSALYQAKNAGRNTVHVITDTARSPQASRGEPETPG